MVLTVHALLLLSNWVFFFFQKDCRELYKSDLLILYYVRTHPLHGLLLRALGPSGTHGALAGLVASLAHARAVHVTIALFFIPPHHLSDEHMLWPAVYLVLSLRQRAFDSSIPIPVFCSLLFVGVVSKYSSRWILLFMLACIGVHALFNSGVMRHGSGVCEPISTSTFNVMLVIWVLPSPQFLELQNLTNR